MRWCLSLEELDMSSLFHWTGRRAASPALWLVYAAVFSALACDSDANTGRTGGPSTIPGAGGAGSADSGAIGGGLTGGGAATGGALTGGATSPGGTTGGAALGGAMTGGAMPTGGTTAGAMPTGGGTTGGAMPGGAGDGGVNAGPDGGMGNVACNASAAPAITKLGLERVVQSSSFTFLVYASQPPGSNDWYLVDAMGYIYVYTNGMVQSTPFLDVSSEVQNSGFGNQTPMGGISNYDERGLLSIAFPPDYATSGKFYVTLIPTSGSLMDHDMVLEYQRSASNPLVADTNTRKAIVDLEPGGIGYPFDPYTMYHNGSTVLFGPDGKLYFGLADGGGDCNAARPGVPQDVSTPYGKILRLDPNAPPPYAAAGNPFASGGDARVFHYGVRNPFRFSFDPLTNDLYIGEVGQWTNDSLAFAPAGSMGLNFGWPSYEGTTKNPTMNCASSTALRAGSTRTNPIFNLAHGSAGGVFNLIVAIVGGQVYRGNAIPALRGAYLFGEFYPNRPMRALYQCGMQTSPITVIQKRCDPNTPNMACFTSVSGAPNLSQVGAIVRGNDGEIYIAANGNALLKVVPAP
jgi:glucose/arabinose dehydrogenase